MWKEQNVTFLHEILIYQKNSPKYPTRPHSIIVEYDQLMYIITWCIRIDSYVAMCLRYTTKLRHNVVYVFWWCHDSKFGQLPLGYADFTHRCQPIRTIELFSINNKVILDVYLCTFQWTCRHHLQMPWNIEWRAISKLPSWKIHMKIFCVKLYGPVSQCSSSYNHHAAENEHVMLRFFWGQDVFICIHANRPSVFLTVLLYLLV